MKIMRTFASTTSLMLAAKAPEDLRKLGFPFMASPKIDGVRAVITPRGVFSRNGKPIPNEYVQQQLVRKQYIGLDGELVVGAPTDADVFNSTQSGVMSRDGTPDFTFYAFDVVPAHTVDVAADAPFEKRFEIAAYMAAARQGRVAALPHTPPLFSVAALCQQELEYLDQGYEGAMLRDPAGIYKHGRSTVRERGLLKLKRFADSEMRVTELEEQQHNTNAAQADALGRTKRSSHKAGLVGAGVLGTLVGTDLHTGQPVRIGTGLTAAQRLLFWQPAMRAKLVGAVVRYKYFASGTKDAPRFPVFSGFRHDL